MSNIESKVKKPYINRSITWDWDCPKCDYNNDDAEFDGESFGMLVCEDCRCEFENYDGDHE